MRLQLRVNPRRNDAAFRSGAFGDSRKYIV